MSWSEDRPASNASSTVSEPSRSSQEGMDPARRDALERVDGLLKGLAADKLLQDDLRHADVQKALEHWTGHRRLSDDEADELMEDNYRVHAVFEKMATLQSCCRVAGIGLPLAQVLAGTGLQPTRSPPIIGGKQPPTLTNDQGRGGAFSQAGNLSANSGTGNTPGGGVGNVGGVDRPKPRRSDGGPEGMPTRVQNRSANRSPGSAPGEAPLSGGGAVQEGDVSLRNVIVEELWKVAVVCLCAFFFAVVLQFFRGDNPLGLAVERGDGGTDEFAGGDEF